MSRASYEAVIQVMQPEGMLDVRGSDQFRDACREAGGLTLPVTVGSVCRIEGTLIYCIGRDHWLIRAPDGMDGEWAARVQDIGGETFCSITIVSDAYCTFRISGPEAVAILAQGTALDLDDLSFALGSCARVSFAKTPAILYRADAVPTFDMHVYRSYADYMSRWLKFASGV